MNPFLALRFNRVRYRSKVSPTAPSFWEGFYFLNILVFSHLPRLQGSERTQIGRDGSRCGKGLPRINRSYREFRSWNGTRLLCIFTIWGMSHRNPQKVWDERGRGQAPPRLHPVGSPCGDGKSCLETLSILEQSCFHNSGGMRPAWQTPSPVGRISGSGHLLQRGWRKSLGCSLWR